MCVNCFKTTKIMEELEKEFVSDDDFSSHRRTCLDRYYQLDRRLDLVNERINRHTTRWSVGGIIALTFLGMLAVLALISFLPDKGEKPVEVHKETIHKIFLYRG